MYQLNHNKQNNLVVNESNVILIIVISGKNNSKCKEATSSKDQIKWSKKLCFKLPPIIWES